MVQRRSERGGATIGVLIVLFVCLAVGGGLVIAARMMASDAKASLSWPTAEATIIRSEVQVVPDREGSDDYDPLVVYTYSVETDSFTGDRIAFGPHNSGDQDAVERTVARYPVGSVVPVAYDPVDRGRSVLEPGNEGFAGIIEWIGYGLFALGLVVLVIGIAVRSRRRITTATPRSSIAPTSRP